MVQGSRGAEAHNAEPLAFNPAAIDALVLSRAHTGPVGRVPLPVKRGCSGPICAQAATCDLFPVMLPGAASPPSTTPRANHGHAPHEPEVVPLYSAVRRGGSPNHPPVALAQPGMQRKVEPPQRMLSRRA